MTENTAVQVEPITDLLRELGRDYANYVVLNTEDERRSLDDVIENILTRLDELKASVETLSTDNVMCLNTTLPILCEKQKELEKIFEKIDRIVSFVSMAKNCVDEVERKVEEAEKTLVPENAITKVFKPLGFFSKKTVDSSEKRVAEFNHPEIFKTSDYFPSTSGEAAGNGSLSLPI